MFAGCSLLTPNDDLTSNPSASGDGGGRADGPLPAEAGVLPDAATDGPGSDGDGTTDAARDTYASAVLADTPAVYYRLEENVGATVVADASGNGRSGSLSGPIAEVGAGAFPASRAVRFAGTFISSAIGSVLSTLPSARYSVEVWLKVDATLPDRSRFPILWRADSSVRWYMFREGATVGNTFEVWGGDGGYVGGVTLPQSPPTNRFLHAVVTFDGTNCATYVDAVPFQTGACSTVGQPSLLVYFAGESSGDRFRGFIDEIAVYDKVLPQARVLAHHNAAR